MLRDQYLIGRALGHGGFGITYLAWDIGLEARLAVKEYMPNGVAGRASGDTKVSAYSEQTKAGVRMGTRSVPGRSAHAEEIQQPSGHRFRGHDFPR